MAIEALAVRNLRVLKSEDGKIVAGSRSHHFNKPWPASPYTPVEDLFVRDNEASKLVYPGEYRLTIGNGSRPKEKDIMDLMMMGETIFQPMVLQCAGDNRTRLKAGTWSGEPWGAEAYGAVLMEGVTLGKVLEQTGGVKGEYVIFTGEDGYQRRLTAEQAADPRLMLAWGMNYNHLPTIHGGPVKLAAPGWYGMQHVKNVARISFTNEPVELKYNDVKYTVPANGGQRPVTEMKVNSRILASDGDEVEKGSQVMKGVAWVGSLPYMHGGVENLVEGVEVSLDRGRNWSSAKFLDEEPVPNMWRRWEFPFDMTGRELEVVSRAIDTRGNVQPLVGTPNPNGYENNSVVPVVLMGV